MWAAASLFPGTRSGTSACQNLRTRLYLLRWSGQYQTGIMTMCEVSQAFARQQWAIRKGCSASIPWINQLFYYTIVVFDERDIRGTIKKMVSASIHHIIPHYQYWSICSAEIPHNKTPQLNITRKCFFSSFSSKLSNTLYDSNIFDFRCTHFSNCD